MELSAEEVQRRFPVWEALAELWLDTEVTDLEYRNIAGRIIESGYTLALVREIHDYESGSRGLGESPGNSWRVGRF